MSVNYEMFGRHTLSEVKFRSNNKLGRPFGQAKP